MSGPRQAFDSLAARLTTALVLASQQKRADLQSAISQLRPSTLTRRIEAARDRLERFDERSRLAFATATERKVAQFKSAWRLIESLSHESVLQRGFALVRDTAGNPAASAALFSPGDAFSVQFHDGTIEGLVQSGSGKKPASRQTPKSGKKPKQGDLF